MRKNKTNLARLSVVTVVSRL